MKLLVKKLMMASAMFFLLSSCGDSSAEKTAVAEESALSFQVQPLKYEALLEKVNKANDTLYLVNFWATWCLPCVKEMPHFIAIQTALQGKPFQLVLVSLDANDQLPTVLPQYLEQKKWAARHYLLDDNNRMNEWISKINSQWDGAIPATAIYRNGKQVAFVAEMLSESELTSLIDQHLPK